MIARPPSRRRFSAPLAQWCERAVLLALCAAIGWFYTWTVRSSGDPWRFGREQRDYYNLLIDGWLDGQLHLKVDVPEALLQLPDPYDPRLRPPGLGLHDASFYRGKYYLYFGAGPVVTLMLPFRVVTGTDLPEAVAALVFTYGAFLASVAVWLAVRRRYFPASGSVVSALCVLALGLASLGPMLLRRPHVWELPMGAGYCFAMLTLLCLWRALHAPNAAATGISRGRLAWFAGAGLCLGLAVASRPTYLVALPLLAVPLWSWWRERGTAPWHEALSALAPLACVGGAMALHNFLRFDHPLQFGQAYQFSLDYESKVEHFSLRYVPFNAWRYFFSAAEWSRYFPFIQPAEIPPKPAGFGGHDDVYGVLANLPLAWFALAAPLALWRRSLAERAPLAAWLGASGVLFAGMTTILLCFFGSIARYMLEFTPTLILLATVGVLALERIVQGWPVGLRFPARLLWGAAVVVSAVFGVLYSLQLNRLLPERNPAMHREVARTLNRFPALVERMWGVRPSAWELALRLPAGRRDGAETLLSLGEAPEPDRVFVRYLAEGRVQFGFARRAMPEVVSEPLVLDAEKPQRLRVMLGAFLPPDTHPWFKDAPPQQARLASRVLTLELNDKPLVQTFRRFDRVAGGRVRIGGRSLGDTDFPRFTGEILAAERVPVEAASLVMGLDRELATPRGDTFKFRVRFPSRRGGAIEPLIVTGATGLGDALAVEYLDEGRIRFLFDHWGSALLRSEPVTLERTSEHELVARLPWLTAASHARAERSGELQVELDGKRVWTVGTMGYHADPEEVAIGANPIGGSHVGARFSGEILSIERTARE